MTNRALFSTAGLSRQRTGIGTPGFAGRINLWLWPALLLVGLLLGLSGPTEGQPKPDSSSREMWGINHLCEYLNLRPDDITYRSDYTEPDSFRLKIVADLMQKPLGMIDYCTSLRKAHIKHQPEIMTGMLFDDLKSEYQTTRSTRLPGHGG